MVTYEARIEALHGDGRLTDAQVDKAVGKKLIGQAKANAVKTKKAKKANRG